MNATQWVKIGPWHPALDIESCCFEASHSTFSYVCIDREINCSFFTSVTVSIAQHVVLYVSCLKYILICIWSEWKLDNNHVTHINHLGFCRGNSVQSFCYRSPLHTTSATMFTLMFAIFHCAVFDALYTNSQWIMKHERSCAQISLRLPHAVRTIKFFTTIKLHT